MKKLEFLTIEHIKDNPLNTFERDHFDDLKNSIIANGLISPISVIGPDKDGTYLLIAGEQRLNVFRELAETEEQYKEIPAYIIGDYDMNPIRQQLLIESDNLDTRENHNKHMHYLNIVKLIKELAESENITGREYYKLRKDYMKCSSRYARFYEQIFDSENEELKEMVSKGELGASRAGRILNMPEEIQCKALADIKSGQQQDEVLSHYTKEIKKETKGEEIENEIHNECDGTIDSKNDHKHVPIDKENCKESDKNELVSDGESDEDELASIQTSGEDEVVSDEKYDNELDEFDEDEEFDFIHAKTTSLHCDSTQQLKELYHVDEKSEELIAATAWCEKMLNTEEPNEDEWELLELCKKLVKKFF